jgi:hypothetical protein
MIAATFLAVFFVPVFYTVIQRLSERFRPHKVQEAHAGHDGLQAIHPDSHVD